MNECSQVADVPILRNDIAPRYLLNITHTFEASGSCVVVTTVCVENLVVGVQRASVGRVPQ